MSTGTYFTTYDPYRYQFKGSLHLSNIYRLYKPTLIMTSKCLKNFYNTDIYCRLPPMHGPRGVWVVCCRVFTQISEGHDYLRLKFHRFPKQAASQMVLYFLPFSYWKNRRACQEHLKPKGFGLSISDLGISFAGTWLSIKYLPRQPFAMT